MKLLPYNIADFERIIHENYYFVDKTKYIQTVEEQSPFVLLTRPRRMGKSLFSSMMMSYYDLAKKDDFDRLFGSLWIGKHTTSWANSFLVLKFDFSYVKYDSVYLEENFNSFCKSSIDNFFQRYSSIFDTTDQEFVFEAKNAKDWIIRLVDRAKLKNKQIYLFVDEYDNFTNTVLTARGVKEHSRITHGEGFYRDFFKGCKGTFARIFMTGVTPVTYDDLYSGFSIADVVSLNKHFNHCIGITEDELRQMIEYYRSFDKIQRPTEQIISEMKPWYDNFCFSEDSYGIDSPIYNTSMVINYMNIIIKDDHTPKSMIDYSARTDSDKLDYLVMTDDLGNRAKRIAIIEEIAAKGQTTGEIKLQFAASTVGDESNFKSMLFYLGTLTFGGYDDLGVPILRVPNKTMGDLYLTYMLNVAKKLGCDVDANRKELDLLIKDAAIEGLWQPLIEEIGNLYHQYTSLRNAAMGEADADGFIRGLLCLSPFYDVWPEAELNHGHGDILLVPRQAPRCPTKHSYLLELKHLRTGNNNPQHAISEASKQLLSYVADQRLCSSHILKGTPLIPIYLVFKGPNLIASGLPHP